MARRGGGGFRAGGFHGGGAPAAHFGGGAGRYAHCVPSHLRPAGGGGSASTYRRPFPDLTPLGVAGQAADWPANVTRCACD